MCKRARGRQDAEMVLQMDKLLSIMFQDGVSHKNACGLVFYKPWHFKRLLITIFKSFIKDKPII